MALRPPSVTTTARAPATPRITLRFIVVPARLDLGMNRDRNRGQEPVTASGDARAAFGPLTYCGYLFLQRDWTTANRRHRILRDSMTVTVVAIFAIVYLGMILGGLPFVQLDRTGVALL